MYYSSHTPRGAAEESGRHGLFGMARRILLGLAVSTAAAAALLTVPALASADTSSTLTIVGTSDVSDSGLMANVVIPAFVDMYPAYAGQVTYVGTGTGQAITSAETGANGASVLLVHAASLENSFVSEGYSYGYPTHNTTLSENYGNALFTNKFILAGRSDNPNPLPSADMHNMAQAFVDVAVNGAAGKAFFVSRGGTPGTTVEEHAIWGLIQGNATLSAELPSDMQLCSVSGANGGGYAPVDSTQSCPAGGAVPTQSQVPSWYEVTGLTQGPNVEAANTCSYGTANNDCFVFTDDGTYANVQNEGLIPDLGVVTSDNSASGALGGPNELVNYFHGYVIDSTTCGCATNLTAAQDFMQLLTSPSMQTEVAEYLDGTAYAETYGNIYTATASPTITASASPASVTFGSHTTISGTVTNDQVGYPALNDVTVHVNRLSPSPATVATGVTDADGNFSISYEPLVTGTYDVTTGTISQIEEPSLDPVFGDVLVAGTSPSFGITVTLPRLPF